MPGDKVQREVEEILAQQEQKGVPLKMTPAPVFRRKRRSELKLSPGLLMFGGLVLVIAALILRKYTTLLAIAALCVFAGGYVWAMVSRSRTGAARAGPRPPRAGKPGEVVWRGQRVNDIQPRRRPGQVVQFSGGWKARLRRFFRGK